jgi:hypothetical protein
MIQSIIKNAPVNFNDSWQADDDNIGIICVANKMKSAIFH